MAAGEHQVVVVGGGSAGVGAAVGAARAGARTLLIERYGFLGGAATVSSVLTYDGFFTQRDPTEQVVAGVGGEVLERIERLGGWDGRPRRSASGNVIVPVDPELTKLALDEIVAEAGVDLLLHARLTAAETASGCLREITWHDHRGPSTAAAAAFVDASGEANLAHLAGAAVEQPEDPQEGTMMMRIGGVAADAELGREAVVAAVRAAAADGVAVRREGGYLGRLPVSGEVIAVLAFEPLDGRDARSLTRAEVSGRAQAHAYLRAFRGHLRGFENAYLVATGPQIGVRETRRLVGRERIVAEDARRGRRSGDGIARAGWPIELHLAGRPPEYEPIGGAGWFDVPAGALVSADFENLLGAGRVLSADPRASGSVRVMGTSFATGHAAGVAAALRAAGGGDVNAVRRELERQGALV